MNYNSFNDEVERKYQTLKKECKMLTINEIVSRF